MIAPRSTGSLRAAVIGCGAISHEHLRHLQASTLAELVAVCDRSEASSRYAQEHYGARRRHHDHHEMLARGDLDVVHVLTPPQTHADLVVDALDAGVHVVCEKPMAPTATEVRRLLDHAERVGRLLVESRNLLYNDPILALDRLVAEGRLGAVRDIDVFLSLDLTAGPFGDPNLAGPGVALPGGAVHDFLPHLAYLFLHFADHHGPVDSVAGHLVNASGNPRVGFDQLDALVRVGEVRGRVRVASDLSPDAFRIRLRGTAGSAETDVYNPYIRLEGGRLTGKRAPIEQLLSGSRLAAASLTNLRDKVLQHGTYHGLPRMLDSVYRSILDGVAPEITPTDMEATAVLTDRLVELAGVPR